MSADAAAVEAIGLRKSYGDVQALCGVDLRVDTGSILGLLGPNGAGKTTAVRILTTLLRPDAGSARVAGFDVLREGPRVRKSIGVAGQYAAVDENLTGLENLEMVGRLYHFARKPARERAAELLADFGLEDAADRPVQGYSGGMRRRLDLAAALVARPPVLFLDEPTTGLDLRSRIGLWEADRGARDRGDDRAPDDAVPRRGRPPRRPHRGDRPRSGDRRGHARRAQAAGGRRAARDPARERQPRGRHGALAPIAEGEPVAEDGLIRVPLRERHGAIAQAVRSLDEADVAIDDIALRSPTLDDVFLTLTGHAAETEEDE